MISIGILTAIFLSAPLPQNECKPMKAIFRPHFVIEQEALASAPTGPDQDYKALTWPGSKNPQGE